MRSGLQRLVHPATSVSNIDLAATSEHRQALHETFRLRQHLIDLLITEDIDSPGLTIEVGDEVGPS